MTQASAPPAPATPARRPVVVLVVVGALVLALSGAAFQGYRDLISARAREQLLTQRKAEAEQRVADLRQRIELLREDPVTLERLAREELGMVKPEDVVIVFPAEKKQ